MRAVQFTTYGGPEVLEIAEVADPQPGPGQIRIGVRATSVNAIDWKIRSGAYGTDDPLPGGLGFDAAGVVDRIGSDVTGVGLGDEVFGLGSPAAAELALLNAWAAKPTQMPWDQAAAAGVGGETAARGLRLLGLTPGDTVLVDGAAGGVGAFVVQVALAQGLTVIGTASEANHEFLSELGATPITYGDGLGDRVRAIAPDGVDGVFDVVGKTRIEDLIALAPKPSQVLSIANFTTAPDAGAQVTSKAETIKQSADLAEIARLYAEGRLRIVVQSMDLAEVAEAHRLSQEGHVRGKLVLTVA